MSGAHFAVVLAAGRSRRMGRDKAGLEWINGQTLLEWTVDHLKDAGWLPIVVLGPHNASASTPMGNDMTHICNERADKGKTTSIAVGASAIPTNASSILVAAVDQPRPAELYRALRLAVHNHPTSIVVPDKHGRNGHPVALKGRMRHRLLTLEEDRLGLRGLLNEFAGEIHRMPCDPEWLTWDCNTPSDYRSARAWFEARALQGDRGTELESASFRIIDNHRVR
jgi:CTP:molybdopterin cytidylyltransferase MocA